MAAVLRRRVLLIDGRPLDRMLLAARLEDEGLEFLEASDGDEGMLLAREHQPDLILMNLRLPGRDGFETIRILKDDPRTRSIPVIFVSEWAPAIDRAQGLDLGAVDFVSKPTDPVELRARVRAALRTKYLQDVLEQRAHLDNLTGLGNRHALEERLSSDWSLCRRRGSPLAVLIADLDHFKVVNDRHGHSVGDEILRRVADALRASLRGGDFVARYGGEEFVIVAPDCDRGAAVSLADRSRAEIAAVSLTLNCRPIGVTTSVGVVSACEPDPAGPAELLSKADRALYRAKAAGRNAVWVWDSARGRPEAARLTTSLDGGHTGVAQIHRAF